MSGMIFDIQRSAMYDGPGIRTVIFLKGCPLSCQWCHNPESQDRERQFAIFEEKCLHCRICESVCPNQAHLITDTDHTYLQGRCTSCGTCISCCPAKALKEYGYERNAGELIDIACQDNAFYQASGGGLTISGGEPFFQFSFLMELLQEAKSHDLHTCIETSGYTTPDRILKTLPFTDVYLYDYKLTTEEDHIAYTGVSNRPILENLDLLYQHDAAIILRCPIIPGVNDNERHFHAIRQLQNTYPKLLGIEIMPYHDLGLSKAHAIGIKNPAHFRVPDSVEKKEWENQIST